MQKRIAEVFDNLDEIPFIVCDTSLEPLGIEKNDMLLLEECDVADIDELIAVKIFGCIVFRYYLEDACDGHVIITFPNKDYAEINTPAFMRKSIVNSLYRVKSYIHYENDDDTHYVRADSLEQIMMLELRSLASFLSEDEQAFADILEAKTNKSILNQQKFLETSIDKAKRGKRSP